MEREKPYTSNEIIDRGRFLHVLDLWSTRAHKAAMAHYRESEICARRNTVLTVLNAVSSITVLFLASSTWLSDVTKIEFNSFNLPYDFLISLSSLLVVLTTILHYLFGYGYRSSRHASSAKSYGALLRKIERYCCSGVCDMDSLHIISKQYSSVTNAAPLVARRRWNSKKLEKFSSYIQDLEENAHEEWFNANPNECSDKKPSSVN